MLKKVIFLNGSSLWEFTVDANVKVLAISRIGEQRIGDKGSGILSILDLSGTVELNDIWFKIMKNVIYTIDICNRNNKIIETYQRIGNRRGWPLRATSRYRSFR